MEFVYIALPLALAIAIFALIAFIWATRSGQFDDLETPSRRVLFDDVPVQRTGEARGDEPGEAGETGEPSEPGEPGVPGVPGEASEPEGSPTKDA